MSKGNYWARFSQGVLSPSFITDRRLPSGEDAVRTRVLVIDDDIEMTDLMKIVLEPNNFEVYAANSGPQGIEAVRQVNPDVIILDLLMPGMDGWVVCKEIRKISTAPILVLSAISKPGMVAQALDEGADDYLLKPMASGVLIAHIKRLARRAHAEQEAKRQRLRIPKISL
jgi:DNA-binding response OmpR family regulator